MTPSIFNRKNAPGTMEQPASTPAKADQAKLMDVLGREFRLVEHGLDPAEVTAFLETVVGSSDAALKRLEHFVSLQRLSGSMEAMIREANDIAASVKEQAKREAEAEKIKVMEDASRRAEQVLSEARRMAELVASEAKGEAEDEKTKALAEAKRNAEQIVNDTYQAAASIRDDAKREAEADKAKVIEETRNSLAETVEQTKKTCSAMVEDTRAILQEANRKADDLVNEARRSCTASIEAMRSALVDAMTRTKEAERLADAGVQSARQASENLPDGIYYQLTSRNERFVKDLPPLAAESVATGKSNGGNGNGEHPAVAEGAVPDAPPARQSGNPVLAALQAQAPEAGNAEKPAASGENGMYYGDVLIAVSGETTPVWKFQFRRRLQAIPGAHVVLQGGDHKQENITSITLDGPVPLLALLKEMPNVASVVEDAKDGKSWTGLNKLFGDRATKQRPPIRVVVKLGNPAPEPGGNDGILPVADIV